MIIPPWSYSALNTFEDCPKRYYHRYILKEKDPETEVTLHGNEVHKALENRVKDNKPLIEAYKEYEPLALSVEKIKNQDNTQIFTEFGFGILKDFTPCDFFHKNVWGRGKADLIVIKNDKAWIGDWKTGKTREKNDQLKIFAAFLFRFHPKVINIYANNIWLKVKKLGTTYHFDREHEKYIWKDIIRQVQRIELMAARGIFDPKPSGLCGWCSVISCPHNPNHEKKRA